MTAWHDFLHIQKGSGLSVSQISYLYKSGNVQTTKNSLTLSNDNAEDLHKSLCAPATVQFIKGHSFVSAKHNNKRMTLVSEPKPTNARKVAWKDISCAAERDCSFIKRSPCKYGMSNKVFFKKARFLKDYISKLATGVITKQEHLKLFEVVDRVCGKKYVNHNRDVALLHFKSI